jgi:SET domain-containing protein
MKPKITLNKVLASFDANDLPFVIGSSPVHGKGAFANRAILPGTFFVEYLGTRLSADEVTAILKKNKGRPNYMFGTDDGIIDGTGYPASYLNHSCSPNVHAIELRGRVFFQAIAHIRKNEELFLDYNFDPVPKAKRYTEYRCLCGSANCRRTMAKVNK